MSVDRVVAEINRLHGPDRARAAVSAQDIARQVARDARDGDLVLVMSNGGFDNVHDKILSALAA
jgi:UDP-N-acetylmuramate: L-alanyl-gamma-D-glutamyl-meso-diaminopimelate ligase